MCSVLVHSDVGAENLRWFISNLLRFMQLEQDRPLAEIDRTSTGPYATNHVALDGEQSRMRSAMLARCPQQRRSAATAAMITLGANPSGPAKNKDQARRCVSVSATVLSSIGLEAMRHGRKARAQMCDYAGR
jgi:hypothetical protein